MNEELVSVGLYSLWDEAASRISVVFTDEGFVGHALNHHMPTMGKRRSLVDPHDS